MGPTTHWSTDTGGQADEASRAALLKSLSVEHIGIHAGRVRVKPGLSFFILKKVGACEGGTRKCTRRDLGIFSSFWHRILKKIPSPISTNLDY
jgi:hypothetical protein